MSSLFKNTPGSAEAPPGASGPSQYSRNSGRILVVEDSRDDQALLVNHLSQQGFRPFVANDGRDGYHKASGLLPDLILMDLRMPTMDGIQSCRLLQTDERTRSIPVIFITASNAVQDRVTGLQAGAVDYIGKPFDLDEVLARVRIHIRLGRRREYAAPGLCATPAATPSEEEVLLAAATGVLEDRLDVPPSTAELAAAIGTHEKRLLEVFRALVGMSVATFIREERLRRSRVMLATTGLEIQSIGALFGYPNAANFSTAFRERFGMSPRAYRQGIRNNKSGLAPST